MRKTVIMLTVIIAVLYSCTHNAVTPKNGSIKSTTTVISTNTPTVPTTPSTSVCFQTEVLPLFQTYCASAGCHTGTSTGNSGDGDGDGDGTFSLTSYAGIMGGITAFNPNGSKYYSIIASGKMPPGNSPKLTSAQITTIATWISQGALNTSCTSTTCDTTQTTYSNGISQIFSTYCNGCHGVAPGSGNVVLSDYASAKTAGTAMKASFLNAINYTSAISAMNMPQAGQLSNCQVKQITIWINNGCPQ